MKHLYHITKKRNLDKILTRGLRTNSNVFGFVDSGHLGYYISAYGMQPIFLTNDIDFIIQTQLTDKWMDDAVVLEVCVSEFFKDLEYEYKYMINNCLIGGCEEKTVNHLNSCENSIINPKTFIYRKNIDPKFIKVM